MLHLILCFLSQILLPDVYAQNSNINTGLPQPTYFYTDEEDLLLKKLISQRYTSPDTALKLADSLIDRSLGKARQQLNYAKGTYWLVWLKSRKQPYFSSYQFLRDELTIATKIFMDKNEWGWLALCYDLAATIHVGQVYNAIQDSSLQDTVNYYLIEAQKALDLSDLKGKDRQSIQADIYHTQAILEMLRETSLGKTALAFQKSLELYEGIGDTVAQAKVFANLIGVVDPDSSLALQEKAVNIYQRLQYPIDEALVYLKLLDYSVRQYRNREEGAWIQYADEAIGNFYDVPETPGEDCNIFSRRGELFELRGDRAIEIREADSLYKKAFDNYQYAYSAGAKSSDIECVQRVAIKMANLCPKIKNCHKAIQGIADSALPNFKEAINAVQADEFERRRYLRANEKLERNQKLLIWLLSGGPVLLILGGFYIFNRVQTRSKQRQRETSRQLELQEARTQRMQMQKLARKFRLDKHFIVNALNNIQGLINLQRTDRADAYVATLGTYLDDVLGLSDGQDITFEEDIDLCKVFIELNQMAFPDKVSYQLATPDPTELPKGIKVPTLIAQPDIENAIKHGLRNRNSLGCLQVTIEKIGPQKLRYIIEDDGVGRKAAAEIQKKKGRKRPSQGGKIVDNAIQSLNQQHSIPPEEAETHPLGAYRKIEDLFDEAGHARGTRVNIIIPFTTKKD